MNPNAVGLLGFSKVLDKAFLANECAIATRAQRDHDYNKKIKHKVCLVSSIHGVLLTLFCRHKHCLVSHAVHKFVRSLCLSFFILLFRARFVLSLFVILFRALIFSYLVLPLVLSSFLPRSSFSYRLFFLVSSRSSMRDPRKEHTVTNHAGRPSKVDKGQSHMDDPEGHKSETASKPQSNGRGE